MNLSEAEKNLLCFLRVQKNPHQLITIRNNAKGEKEHFIVQSESKWVIDAEGIREIIIKSK
jgi:hypothetical protein